MRKAEHCEQKVSYCSLHKILVRDFAFSHESPFADRGGSQDLEYQDGAAARMLPFPSRELSPRGLVGCKVFFRGRGAKLYRDANPLTWQGVPENTQGLASIHSRTSHSHDDRPCVQILTQEGTATGVERRGLTRCRIECDKKQWALARLHFESEYRVGTTGLSAAGETLLPCRSPCVSMTRWESVMECLRVLRPKRSRNCGDRGLGKPLDHSWYLTQLVFCHPFGRSATQHAGRAGALRSHWRADRRTARAGRGCDHRDPQGTGGVTRWTRPPHCPDMFYCRVLPGADSRKNTRLTKGRRASR